MTAKPYPKYKNCEIPWLERLPEGWEVKRLALIGKFSKGGGISKADLVEIGIPVILYGDIYTKYDLRANEIVNQISFESSVLAKRIKNGDLLLTGSGETKEDIGKCVVYEGNEVVYAGGDVIIFTQTECSSLFLSYFLNSSFARFEKARYSKGEIIVHIYASKLRELPVPVPPLPEQTQIAAYLDHKCALIATAIEKKTLLIERLREQKQAIINRAVTRGIRAGVKMKDSGVAWLGEVPEGWEVKRLKFVSTTTSGGTPESSRQDDYYNGHVNWVRTTDLNDGELFDLEIKITEKALKETACKIVPSETVLIAMYGGEGTIGKNAILKIPATVNQAVCALQPDQRKLLPYFLLYFVKFYRPHWMFDAVGSRKDPNISQEIIKNILIPIPPIKEQLSIIEHIEKESTTIETTTARIHREIELLKEYKTALIAEAVTGRIDVRGWQQPTKSA
jgi:type I restriction enzyme S subunit